MSMSVQDRWRETGEKTVDAAATVVDPLGIGRSLIGREATDPIGSRTQEVTNDALEDSTAEITDFIEDKSPSSAVPDWLSWGLPLILLTVVLAALSYTFGQLFDIQLG